MYKRKLSKVDWPQIDANPLEFLVAPEAFPTFLAEVWEKQPKVYKANDSKKEYFDELCSLEQLYNILDGGFYGSNPALNFGEDMNAARYRDGVRETLNGKKGNFKTVMRLFEDEGCTIQLHQPQRFSDDLWRLIAALEKQLGCLVGANAYHTPAETQGLAPHYDDVDLWVCQTLGSKHWKIYKSPEGYQLPAISSTDFQQTQLGKPILETTLEVGDVLYMPRGTIHQAAAQDYHSVHVTISTYQKWALADFAVNLMQELQTGRPSTKGRFSTPLITPQLRQGLPLNFLGTVGLQHQALANGRAKAIPQVAKNAAEGLRALAEQLEKDSSMTTATADRMAIDFFENRAPPCPETLPKRGRAPEMTSLVQSFGSSYFRITPCDPSPEVTEAYKNSSNFVSVISCLNNERETHMMGDAYKKVDWYSRGVKFDASEDEEDKDEDTEEDSDDDDEDDDGAEEEDEDEKEEARRPHKDQNGEQGKPQLVKEGDLEDAGQLSRREEAGKSFKEAFEAQRSGKKKKKAVPDEEEIDLGSQDESDEEDDLEELGGNTLVFPASYTEALIQLLIQDSPVAVTDIQLDDKDERLGLAYSLWAENYVTTTAASAAKPSAKKRRT